MAINHLNFIMIVVTITAVINIYIIVLIS